ncbi:MAG: hypothetical protein L3K08_02930 [Thermoplasmata archaeon]|nr:hypothetical protein [Thermoplasmata archaeon]
MAVLVLLVVLLALPGVSPNVGSRADAPARSTVGLPHSMGAALAHPGTSLPVHLAARIHPAGGSGKIWTNLTAASPITPTSREEFALASDPAANITLFFGGFSTNNNGGVIYPLLNDTWEFANGAWKDITGTAGTAPSPRLGPQMVYDSADGYFLLWGGLNYTKGAGYYLTDTWKFTPGTGTWTNITSSVNTPPTGLYIPTMAYDVKDKEAVLFGGSVGGTGVNGKGAKPFQETWTYSNLVWTNLTATLGAGQPPARYAAAMSWDGYDNEVVLYGGLKTAATFWADTWVFKANAWTDVTPVSQTATNNPAPVRGAMMASDLGSSGYALLFGGIDSNSTVRNETWVFYNQTWSNMTAYVGLPPPQPRVQYDGGAAYGAMAYDNQTQSVVLYGGFVIWSGGFNDGTENLTWGYKWSNISVVLTANRTQIPQNSGVTFTAVARGGTFNYSYVYANDTLGVTNALPAGCVSKNLPSITCFPSGTGFFNITVTATDTNSVTAKALDVAIHVFPPFTSMLSISKRAIDYNEKVTITTTYAGGTGKGLTFVYSGLPPGCSSGLASFTCVPKGVGAIGNFTISVKVTDSVADVAKSS